MLSDRARVQPRPGDRTGFSAASHFVVACFAIEPDGLQATQTEHQTPSNHQDSEQLNRIFGMSSIHRITALPSQFRKTSRASNLGLLTCDGHNSPFHCRMKGMYFDANMTRQRPATRVNTHRPPAQMIGDHARYCFCRAAFYCLTVNCRERPLISFGTVH